MMIVSLVVAKKTENGIGIHTDGETGIGTDPENTGIGIVTGPHGKSVIVTVTGIDVTEKGDIVTVTKVETEKDERSGRREKTEINPKNKEKKNDIARLRAPKRLAAQKRENLYPVRKRAEEHANQKKQRTKILSRERRVSGLLHHDPVICVAVWSKNFSVSTESALSIKLPSSFLFWTQNVVHTSVSSVTHGQGVYLERLVGMCC